MIYGLIGVGYTMVYGIIALTALAGITAVPLGLLAALLLCAALGGLYGFSIERVAYRPLRGSFRLAPLISAIGMSILLSNFVQVAQGPRNKSIPPLVPGGITLMDQDDYQVTLSYKQM